MNWKIVPYDKKDFDTCVGLFDFNSPKYFLEEERAPFLSYLRVTKWYYLVTQGALTTAAFGLQFIPNSQQHARLHWIMVHPGMQGQGIGSFIMEWIFQRMEKEGSMVLEVDTSQVSVSFFERYNIEILETIKNGWGSGMDRINLLLYRP